MKDVKCVEQCWENRCLQIRGGCCEVFTDPKWAWKDGTCQALRNTPEQMKKLRDELRDYEVRMNTREGI